MEGFWRVFHESKKAYRLKNILLTLALIILSTTVRPALAVLRCYECQGARDTCERNIYITNCNNLDRYCEITASGSFPQITQRCAQHCLPSHRTHCSLVSCGNCVGLQCGPLNACVLRAAAQPKNYGERMTLFYIASLSIVLRLFAVDP